MVLKRKLQIGFLVLLILIFIANQIFHFGTSTLDKGLIIFFVWMLFAFFIPNLVDKYKKKHADSINRAV